MTKTALILGASSGVGAATARELSRRGWIVVLAARSEAKLREIRDSIGSSAHFKVCDATSTTDMAELEDFTRKEVGVPLVVVNCAGVGQWKRIENTTPEEARTMISAPYLAAFGGSRMFMPDMLGRKSGVLIHVNSPACYMPWPSAVGYTAARFALRGLHEALSQDLAGTGVHSCHVVFGRIDSEYFEHNSGVAERMPGIASTIRTLSTSECARILADVAENPRQQTIYPTMLRLYYWSNLVTPWLTRWIMRVTGAKT